MQQPVFISLVGPEAETDELCNELQVRLRKELPDKPCLYAGDPLLGNWSAMKIAGKQKKEFSPLPRLFLRWGLFAQFILDHVVGAFRSGTPIVLVRRFGFDVYAGAVAYNHCTASLGIHEELVKNLIGPMGLCPPLYIFTSAFDDRTQTNIDAYFRMKGQRKEIIDPALSKTMKVSMIIGIVRAELDKMQSKAA